MICEIEKVNFSRAGNIITTYLRPFFDTVSAQFAFVRDENGNMSDERVDQFKKFSKDVLNHGCVYYSSAMKMFELLNVREAEATDSVYCLEIVQMYTEPKKIDDENRTESSDRKVDDANHTESPGINMITNVIASMKIHNGSPTIGGNIVSSSEYIRPTDDIVTAINITTTPAIADYVMTESMLQKIGHDYWEEISKNADDITFKEIKTLYHIISAYGLTLNKRPTSLADSISNFFKLARKDESGEMTRLVETTDIQRLVVSHMRGIIDNIPEKITESLFQ